MMRQFAQRRALKEAPTISFCRSSSLCLQQHISAAPTIRRWFSVEERAALPPRRVKSKPYFDMKKFSAAELEALKAVRATVAARDWEQCERICSDHLNKLDFPLLRITRAEAFHSLERYAEAKVDLEAALQQDPAAPDAWRLYALVLVDEARQMPADDTEQGSSSRQQKLDQALSHANTVERLDPSDPEAFHIRALVHMISGKEDEAIAAWEKA